jgi:flagellar hook protein FlgE
MSFQQGLSGLNAASKQLEVIGNNVANSNTVGFKAARAEFADVYANSLTGGGGIAIGIGTKLATVSQQFTQGNITSSGNSLDIAINGGGFFEMSASATDLTKTYSRNGQFHLDQYGYIVDASNKNLNGWTADILGNLQKGSIAPLKLSTDELAPKTTATVVGLLNLDSRKPFIDPAITAFDPTDPATYSDSTAVTVYDSLGNSHTIQTFFVKTPDAAQAAAMAMPRSTAQEIIDSDAAIAAAATGSTMWSLYNTADNIPTGYVPPAAAVTSATLTYTGLGRNPTVTPTVANAITGLPEVTFTPVTGATVPLTLTMDYSGSTQFGSSFSINDTVQDGYASGRLAGFNTSADGTIVGRYTNGQSKIMGQVTLTQFKNPNALQPIGGNGWAETADSGKLDASSPGSGQLGLLQSSALEESNSDLTAELVNMITAQRFYQANAQTIKTQDQVLQTLVNLR